MAAWLYFLFVVRISIAFLRCETDADCSYLGKCDANSSTCDCNQGWYGTDCHLINITSTIDYATDGYHDPNGLSTWDGSPIRDPSTGLYHLYISVLTDNCTASMYLYHPQYIYFSIYQ